MKFETVKRKESVTYPGVFFTVRILTQGVKNNLLRLVAAPVNKLRDIQAELEDMLQQIPRHACGEACAKPCPYAGGMDIDHKLTAPEMARITKLQADSELVRQLEINPAYMETCFVSVEGMEIEGVTGDIKYQDFTLYAPPDLHAEVMALILGEGGLSGKEEANLSSPTTLAAGADGQTSDSSAATASEKATT